MWLAKWGVGVCNLLYDSCHNIYTHIHLEYIVSFCDVPDAVVILMNRDS